jgi:hypothetical protein
VFISCMMRAWHILYHAVKILYYSSAFVIVACEASFMACRRVAWAARADLERAGAKHLTGCT